MALVQGSARYALINTSTNQFELVRFGYYYDDESGPAPEPAPVEGHIFHTVSDEDLGGLTEKQFEQQKKPILSGDPLSFDSWEDRHTGLDLSISANPISNGSNTPYVIMENGLPNASYTSTSTSGISINSEGTGTLDGTGDGTFRVQVVNGSLEGSVTVLPDGHSDFKPVTLELTIEEW